MFHEFSVDVVCWCADSVLFWGLFVCICDRKWERDIGRERDLEINDHRLEFNPGSHGHLALNVAWMLLLQHQCFMIYFPDIFFLAFPVSTPWAL